MSFDENQAYLDTEPGRAVTLTEHAGIVAASGTAYLAAVRFETPRREYERLIRDVADVLRARTQHALASEVLAMRFDDDAYRNANQETP